MKTQSNQNVGNGSDSEHSLPLLVGRELEIAERLEASAWERCEREIPQLAAEREKIGTQIDEIRAEWANRFSNVRRLKKLQASNAQADR